MIGTESRNPQTYVAGAMLDNGAKLVEIYSDRVVLERQRERVTLYLLGKAQPEESSALLAVGGSEWTPPAETHYSTDPATNYIRAVPAYSEAGELTGFRVYPGTQRSWFSEWGLKPGDVIRSMNGAALVDADQVTQALGTLTQGATLSARILRGSENVAVTLDGTGIQKLNQARLAAQSAAPATRN